MKNTNNNKLIVISTLHKILSPQPSQPESILKPPPIEQPCFQFNIFHSKKSWCRFHSRNFSSPPPPLPTTTTTCHLVETFHFLLVSHTNHTPPHGFTPPTTSTATTPITRVDVKKTQILLLFFFLTHPSIKIRRHSSTPPI